MSIDADRERLSQRKVLESMQCNLTMNVETDMLTVYATDETASQDYRIYCALIPFSQLHRALSNPAWDLELGQGMPDAVSVNRDEAARFEYRRYGVDDGIEPLIVERHFCGIQAAYCEISEEFRLFHKLFHDKQTDRYIKIDDTHTREVVAVVEPKCIKIRLKELRQFLAIKEMYLSIQFRSYQRSGHALEELGLRQVEPSMTKSGLQSSFHRKNLVCWQYRAGSLDSTGSYQAFTELVGKRLVKPLPKSQSGFYGFAGEPKYTEFIIGSGTNGEPMTYSCNPDALKNSAGVNSDAPYYLTPVYFRKQVLDKYAQQPRTYTLKNWEVRCGDLWELFFQTHDSGIISAPLGVIGRSLPYEEQRHWRVHNIAPDAIALETETYKAPGSIEPAYMELLDVIARGMTPQELVDFRASEATNERLADLLYRAKTVGITADETAELTHHQELNHLMTLIKTRARQHLKDA